MPKIASCDSAGLLPIKIEVEGKQSWLIRLERDYRQALPADGYIRRYQALDVPIQREQFPLKSRVSNHPLELSFN